MAGEQTERTQTLVVLFMDAARQMVNELVRRMVAAGYTDIRPAYSRVFENLDRDGNRVSDLAARAQMSHPAMTELIEGLERAGYVQRDVDPTDRRARLVRFTSTGRAMQRQALRELATIEQEWLRRLGPDLARELPQALVAATRNEASATTSAP